MRTKRYTNVIKVNFTKDNARKGWSLVRRLRFTRTAITAGWAVSTVMMLIVYRK